jgi:hypothetical protein
MVALKGSNQGMSSLGNQVLDATEGMSFCEFGRRPQSCRP